MKDFLKVLVFGGIFLVPFLPVYVANEFFFPFITGKNFAFRIIVEVMFSAWVILALLDERYRPRFSYIFAGFGALLVVMFFANIFGEYPLKSFWSNYERMDGYVTLLHVFLLMLVMGSVMTTERLWTYFFYTSATVALFVALFGLAQMAGLADGGRNRLDSRLGNAAYMAVYMLFHMFIAAWLIVRSQNWLVRFSGVVVIGIFAYALLLTGTRGTILGFVVGAIVSVLYMVLFGRQYPELRKIAAAGFVGLIILGAGFFALRDSQFIQDNRPLARIANIDIMKDLETRGVIWSMALEGVKERPVLGWGQGNFNYVFNKEFEPVLYNKEAWFDRVHNIVLDWLIAGGVLGFLAYSSIFFALLYYLVWLPFMKGDERIDVLERAVIVGLIAGYVMHNLVVFDNIISYIFFASILALVHFRISEQMPSVQNFRIDDRLVNQIVAPVLVVITGAVIYFANAPGIQAAGDIIDAMRAPEIRGRLEQFHEALSRGSFADQEIVEQLVQQAIRITRNPNLPAEDRDLFIQRSELELMKLIEQKPGDARLHNFFATFYRSIGALPQAQEQGAIARSLSPAKQAIILEQAVTELQIGNIEAARDFFKEAYELYTTNSRALVLYAAAEVQLGNVEAARSLIGEEHMLEFASNDFALNAVNQSGDRTFLAEIFESRIAQRPNDAQNWASLSFVYFEQGDKEKSIETLERAAETVPSFATQANCFVENIKADREPAEGCSSNQ